MCERPEEIAKTWPYETQARKADIVLGVMVLVSSSNVPSKSKKRMDFFGISSAKRARYVSFRRVRYSSGTKRCPRPVPSEMSGLLSP